MCGIVGVWTQRAADAGRIEGWLQGMARSVAHRGPDSSGFKIDGSNGLGLGHQRLAIVDLSENGAQPMQSASGRYWITFNGEIFGHHDVRKVLDDLGANVRWRGKSDTEVLVEAIDYWGVSEALARVEGQFAFGVWDAAHRELTLGRDRFGEKPLYYCLEKERLSFGSSLAAIDVVVESESFAIDRRALSWLCESSYIPAPLSIFESVKKVPAGTFIVFRRDDIVNGNSPNPRVYWCSTTEALKGHQSPFLGSVDEAVLETERLLKNSIEKRLVADVPVGVMVSGGIDSTCIAGLSQELSTGPIKTFTIGFAKTDYDESPYALEAAREIGTDHTTLHLDAGAVAGIVNSLATIYDEPFADSSQIAMVALSRLARERVTVALGGDGGDELFGGYARHGPGSSLWNALSQIPKPIRTAAGKLGDLTIRSGALGLVAQISGRKGLAADRLQKAVRLFSSGGKDEYYQRLIGQANGNDRDRLIEPPEGFVSEYFGGPSASLPFSKQMMLADTAGYLSHDILTKVDRASMAVGLEVRSPFLDLALFQFAWSLPESALMREGMGKAPLRSIAKRLAPSTGSKREKHGFAVPLGAWLRGPLAEWSRDLLASKSIGGEDAFSREVLERLLAEHNSGARDNSQVLWPVLMFRSWEEARSSRQRPFTHRGSGNIEEIHGGSLN